MKIILSLLIIATIQLSFGQVYNNPGGTINTCGGTFYDTGGAAGNYSNNENITTTICSNSGSCIQLDFSSLVIAKNDLFTIHDGTTATLANQIASAGEGTYAPFSVASTTGCLTFQFTSANPNEAAGWAAVISCCVAGCTDPAGLNYNALATVDDGSCTYPTPDYDHGTVGINSERVTDCLVTDCGPSSYTDDGGFGGDYSNNILGGLYRVFCPEIAGNCMRVTFNSFETYNSLDYLTVGNGPTQNSTVFTSAPANASGQIFGAPATPFSYTSTDASGCLTFRFTSSGANTADGWSAILECVPCAGGPNGTDNNDCITMTPLCSAATVGGNATGPGIVAEGCTGSDCPAGGENHTNWYTFTAQTSGTLNVTITPQTGTDDYDFAIYGPNVTCNTLGSPIRCTDAGATGTTGLTAAASDNTEDVSGDKFLATMNVTAGESFILVVDEWSSNAGSGYNLSFGGTASLDCTILPVELRIFDATYNEDYQTVDLTWVTETELNCDRFEVQKSIDGINYRTIGELKGAGTTTNQRQYIYIDNSPFSGVNYYRLEQFDNNGESNFTEVQAVNVLDQKFDVLSLTPNPNKGNFELTFNSYTSGNAQLKVSNFRGEEIYNESFKVNKGGNHKPVALHNKPGAYLITLVIESKVYHQRLIIE